MMILALALTVTPAYQCRVNDAACWMTAALAQQERAEREEARADQAESRVKLLEEAVTIGNRLLADSDARALRWQKLAEKVAPKDPAFWERPPFWLGTGFGLGVLTAVGIVAAVNHPR